MPTARSTPPITRSSSIRSTLEDDARMWLVRVTDITAHVQIDARTRGTAGQVQTQGEILRSVLHMGGARFAALFAANRRLDEDHQLGPEEAGARGRGIPRQARGGSRRGRSGAARCRGIQAHRPSRAPRVSSRTRCTICAAAASLSGSEFLPLARQVGPALRPIRLLEIPDPLAAPARAGDAQADAPQHDGKRHSNHTGAEIRGAENADPKAAVRAPAARPRPEASRTRCARSPITSRRSTTRP